MPQSNAPRIKGDYMRLTLGGVTVAEAFDVSVRVNVQTIESAAFGDNWKVKQSSVGEFQITARRYMRVADIGRFVATAVDEAENVNQRVLRAVVYAGAGSSEVRVFEGDVIVSSAVLSAPHGQLVTEEITFEGTGEPVFPAGLV